ncbi:hypothetical protein HY409_03975 [Candidatus Gottesmanbacteria bacterium]|nr:hypothetical protein [Candidatus Gottesmanbacteria bacterium]
MTIPKEIKLLDNLPIISIPELSLDVSIAVSAGDVRAVDCLPHAPTLRELRLVVPHLKEKSGLVKAERGEWTADFINYDIVQPEDLLPGYVLAECISRPETLRQERNRWVAEGGERAMVILPPSGWVVPDERGRLYDEKTALPLHTTQNPLDPRAKDSLYAYFWRSKPGTGVRAVNRECERVAISAFEVSATQSPDFSHWNIGVRKIHRYHTAPLELPQNEPLNITTDVSITIRQALQEAIAAKRADALMLSGGIDSSFLAALDPTIPAFTAVLEGHGEDLNYAQRITDFLGIHWYGIELSEQESLHRLRELIYLTRTYDPALLNDIPLYAAMIHAASLGARVIRTGDFADTLFIGYEYLWTEPDLKQYITILLPHLTLASGRLATIMGLDTHFPYLHPRVLDVGMKLKKQDNLARVRTSSPGDTIGRFTQSQSDDHTWSKIALRRAALPLLPIGTVFRSKADLEFGSGMYRLEKRLEALVTKTQLDHYHKQGKRFWNKMHAAIYSIYQ